jgi:hypothetical protein
MTYRGKYVQYEIFLRKVSLEYFVAFMRNGNEVQKKFALFDIVSLGWILYICYFLFVFFLGETHKEIKKKTLIA